MGTKTANQDRYLLLRNGNYFYKRRVPASLTNLDERSLTIQISLRTTDLIIARTKRDLHEKADNDLWAALTLDANSDTAMERYKAAMKQVEAFGLTFKTASDLAKASLDSGLIN